MAKKNNTEHTAPTTLDFDTAEELKPAIFKCLNPENYNRSSSRPNSKNGGSIENMNKPQVTIPAMCRVNYIFTEDEKAQAAKEGRKLPKSQVLTLYYDNGQIGYVEDLGLQQPKEFMSGLKPILFTAAPDVDGSLCPLRVVEAHDESLIRYLRECSYNRDSASKHPEHTSIFYEYKPQDVAKGRVRADKVTTRAKAYFMDGIDDENPEVRNAIWTKHLAIAFTFGVDIFGNPAEVERNVLWLIQNNAPKFVEAMNNPLNLMKFVIQMAERAQVIYVDRTTNTVKWKDSMQLIATFARGYDVYEEFTKWCAMKENDNVYFRLKQLWENSSQTFVGYSEQGVNFQEPDEKYLKLAQQLN
jgi:hypothetical protein